MGDNILLNIIKNKYLKIKIIIKINDFIDEEEIIFNKSLFDYLLFIPSIINSIILPYLLLSINFFSFKNQYMNNI